MLLIIKKRLRIPVIQLTGISLFNIIVNIFYVLNSYSLRIGATLLFLPHKIIK